MPLPVPLGRVLSFSIPGGLAFPFSERSHLQVGSALSQDSLAFPRPCLVPLSCCLLQLPQSFSPWVLAHSSPWTFPPGLTSAHLHTLTSLLWSLSPSPAPKTLCHPIYRRGPVCLPKGRVLYTTHPQSPAQGKRQQMAVEGRKDPGRDGQIEAVPPARLPGVCGGASP